MPTVRRSVTRLALLAFASGCSGLDEPEPVLHPVLNERGLITYVAEGSDAPPFRENTRNALLIERARDAQSRGRGPGPQDAPPSPQGRSEPIWPASPDPKAEEIKRLEERARILNAQRDLLYSQDKPEKPRSALAERLQADREWHQAWQARRDQDRQDDAMRHQRETQAFNDGFRELLRTQQQNQREWNSQQP